MRRLMKLLHEIGGIGMAGALAAHLVLVVVTPTAPVTDYAAVRQAILAITQWMLLPSLLLVLFCGLMAMAVHPPFHNARWVWAKALTGVGLLEGTLVTIQSTSRQLAEVSARAAAGQPDPQQLAELQRTEWIGLWTILLLCLLNVVLGVMRPRLGAGAATSA